MVFESSITITLMPWSGLRLGTSFPMRTLGLHVARQRRAGPEPSLPWPGRLA
jgi:hypothetical protein